MSRRSGAAGMGAFAAVAQGSAQDAQLIQLDYEPAAPRGPHLGLVGKARDVRLGGLALKPRDGMDEMKFDMCGGGGGDRGARRRWPSSARRSRVTGVVGATENLPSGRAVKPGDIVRALDGTTIEVNNPDAEGRLVLADCLVHARRHGCERLVDIATLTGGVVTALGSVYAGADEPTTRRGRRWSASAATAPATGSGSSPWTSGTPTWSRVATPS